MNNVVARKNTAQTIAIGDVFFKKDDNYSHYILAYLGHGKFGAVNLSTGNLYTTPCYSLEEAVAGLELFAKDAKITIEDDIDNI